MSTRRTVPSGVAIGPSEKPRPWQTTASVETVENRRWTAHARSVRGPPEPLNHATFAGLRISHHRAGRVIRRRWRQ